MQQMADIYLLLKQKCKVQKHKHFEMFPLAVTFVSKLKKSISRLRFHWCQWNGSVDNGVGSSVHRFAPDLKI